MKGNERLTVELSPELDEATFGGLYKKTLEVLKKAKEESKDGRIGYVSGIISSDGPEFIERNRTVLQEKTKRARESYDFPIFSANDIFSPQIVERLGYKNSDYIGFWRNILNTGFITDVIMTSGWERSLGATDEHTTSEILGLNIIYEEEAVKFKPPTGYELQDRLRRVFLEGNEELVETVKTARGVVWHRMELNFRQSESIVLSNASGGRLTIRGRNSDRIFQFGIGNEGLAWIEGAYKVMDEEGKEKEIYLKEFFHNNYEKSLVQDIVDWTVSSVQKREVLEIPSSIKEYEKPRSWTRKRL